jgi:hypothetical protein
MLSVLIPAVAGVVIALVATAGSLLSSRNDRQMTLLEFEILAKLPADSQAAHDMSRVIDTRIQRWRERLEGNLGTFISATAVAGLLWASIGVALVLSTVPGSVPGLASTLPLIGRYGSVFAVFMTVLCLSLTLGGIVVLLSRNIRRLLDAYRSRKHGNQQAGLRGRVGPPDHPASTP